MAAVLAETDGARTGGDDEKPVWDDDIDVDDIIPPSGNAVPHTSAAKDRKKAKKKERKKRVAEDEANAVDVDEMDADAPSVGGSGWDDVEWDGTEEMRKRVLDQYMEEINELEFNDMVRSLPLSFIIHAVLVHAHAVRPHRLQGAPPASATFQWRRLHMG
jgi:protein KRI1